MAVGNLDLTLPMAQYLAMRKQAMQPQFYMLDNSPNFGASIRNVVMEPTQGRHPLDVKPNVIQRPEQQVDTSALEMGPAERDVDEENIPVGDYDAEGAPSDVNGDGTSDDAKYVAEAVYAIAEAEFNAALKSGDMTRIQAANKKLLAAAKSKIVVASSEQPATQAPATQAPATQAPAKPKVDTSKLPSPAEIAAQRGEQMKQALPAILAAVKSYAKGNDELTNLVITQMQTKGIDGFSYPDLIALLSSAETSQYIPGKEPYLGIIIDPAKRASRRSELRKEQEAYKARTKEELARFEAGKAWLISELKKALNTRNAKVSQGINFDGLNQPTQVMAAVQPKPSPSEGYYNYITGRG